MREKFQLVPISNFQVPIKFQLGETVVDFPDVKLIALFLVLVFAASSHLFCQR